ncbi:MAG: hypothetical protein A2161_01075 [Candidatus Schekmanbacteria bacterium RBG_13_48_7]|uniref:Polysaccharide biosynthesis protein CapD-like domain-containing protein n=1 Tax=Candidatus Schekmanbacteria bacterium RBG_13_48_7 TaxID=1817878 RepID=A0A1F7RMM5_9BACT|nr:MAG: hypothetical protein A2161_01075 [Candidatus Schekmanbacteria bacterium RBG_13_48_7]
MKTPVKSKLRKFRLAGIDLVLFLISYLLAYWLRSDNMESIPVEVFISGIPLVIGFKILVFYGSGIYQKSWRIQELRDLIQLLRAVSISSLLLITGVYLLGLDRFFARKIFFLDYMVTIIFICGARLLLYIVSESFPIGHFEYNKRALIVGTGSACSYILREIKHNPRLSLQVVGIIDDDNTKLGFKIDGCPILGNFSSIPKWIQWKGIETIILAMTPFNINKVRELLDLSRGFRVQYHIVPALGDFLAGKISRFNLRPLRVEDLLHREEVIMDTETIRNSLKGKKVLVTGAGGSIGSELCRQIAPCQPLDLILLERNESTLFYIERELRKQFPELSIIPLILDITSQPDLEFAFKRFLPDIVYHAAAYKHVPMMERNPFAAVSNNVFGTIILAQTAIAHKTSRLVMISTDKAVEPNSIMGVTKRTAELYFQEIQPYTETLLMTVRFGNVLDSIGSVVPLFKRQINELSPVTVTHHKAERYFMTISEATHLVLQAGNLGKGGEIFVLDMGKPIKIIDLARDMILLSGYIPDHDIPIKITGLRPGEKLEENLFFPYESPSPTANEKILVVQYKQNSSFILSEHINELKKTLEVKDLAGMISLCRKIVPEYTPSSLIQTKLLLQDERFPSAHEHPSGSI